jgi:hypothetical protein
MPNAAASNPPMTETIDSANATASSLFLGHNGEWWDFWLIISLVFVALAAIAAGVTTAGSIFSHKREAAAAEAALDRFKLDTEQKISEANARTADAKLELAKFKAPRILTGAQQSIVAGKVSAFRGTKFDAGIGPKGDPEPLYLLRSIVDSLKSVGWVQVPWTGDGETYTEAPLLPVGLTMVTNVIVDVHPEHLAALGPAAKALADALNAEGIDALADSRPTTIHTEVIHIRIGRKL